MSSRRATVAPSNDRSETRGEAAEAPIGAPELILLAFCVWQAIVIGLRPLLMDELNTFSQTQLLWTDVPYRDRILVGGKTVLGIYLLLPWTAWTTDPWLRLVATKLSIVVVVAVVLALLCRSWRRSSAFRRSAVSFALLTWLSTTTLGLRLSELRVDPFLATAGLLSLAFLLDRRFARSGVAAAVAVLISQKGLLFAVAGGSAILAARGPGLRPRLQATARFVGSGLLVAALYAGFWTAVGGGAGLLTSLETAGTQATNPSYSSMTHLWWISWRQNPVFWILGLLAAIVLLVRPGRNDLERTRRDRGLAVYGLVLLALAFAYAHPWHYFVMTITPTWFVLLVALYDRVLAGELTLGRASARRAVAGATGLGILLSALHFPAALALRETRERQESTLRLADALLAPGVTYLEGSYMPLEGEPLGMRRPPAFPPWLDRQSIDWLHDADPEVTARTLETITRIPPALVITNYRIRALPPAYGRFLAENYTPFWGNVFLYGPTILPGDERIAVPWGGRFQVRDAFATIAGRRVEPGDVLDLDPGWHPVRTESALRLVALPKRDVRPLLDPKFRNPGDLYTWHFAEQARRR